MKRLTFKVNDAYYVKDSRHLYDDTWELVQKLGAFEDLEEELGIDLITLFKAIKSKSIFTKYDGKISEHIEDNYNERDWYMQDKIVYFYWEDGSHLCFEFKDYGKTFALTKEELENE